MNRQEFNEYKQKEMFKDGVKLGPSMILSKNLEKPMYTTHMGNENVMVIGGSGSGKIRSVINPNLLQMTGSYIVNDPYGEIYGEVGNVMEEYGYTVKVLDPFSSDNEYHYNPFHYIQDKSDVELFVNHLLTYTDEEDTNDARSRHSVMLLFLVCITYLIEICEDETRRNFASIINMINAYVREEDNAKSDLEVLLESIPKDSLTWKYYRALEKTGKYINQSIAISCITRAYAFMDPETAENTKTDNLELDKLCEKKTVIFLTNHSIYKNNALFSLLIMQAQNAVINSNAKRKFPVTFILNEFESLGKIPKFASSMSVGEKFKISYINICMNLELLESIYDKDVKLMIANCSTLLYLGNTNDSATFEYLENLLTSENCSIKKQLHGINQKNCIVFSTNHKPMIDKKYDLKKHPLYYRVLANQK